MWCEDYEPELQSTPDRSLDRLANHLATFIASERASRWVQRLVPGTVRRALVVVLAATARSLTSPPAAVR
jgi:hypothetical protein